MGANCVVPENAEERLIFRAIIGGWIFYGLGALYVVGPALAVSLLGMFCWRHFVAPVRPALRPTPVPAGVWVWIAGMAAMLLTLLVAHIENELGFGQTLKSTIGWTKGWALLALFPLAGACLRIRYQVVIRAMGWFALQTACITPVLVLAALAHLPSRLFVSPLQAVGGPGPEFFAVYLYIVDPSNGALRWQFVAPWAPAAGMMGDMIFMCAWFEADRRWRWLGLIIGTLVVLMTKSRMALLFLVVFPLLLWVLSRLVKPRLLTMSAVGGALFGIVGDALLSTFQDAVAAFKGARADSTRVREALGRIAVERWQSEAPVWGHGVVIRGSHHVEFMPIGSHHTWFGLLYVKGAVGAAALAIPLAWTAVEMLLLAQVEIAGRIGLSVLIMLVFYSFGENLEILAYLAWPALLLLGCAFARARDCESDEPVPAATRVEPTGCGTAAAAA
ncbi:MAG: O-antigen ligase domain-containing protein [Proteobacteria bacterium]|nr:O-antigen ligase domain-containing protein [Pseudomonadota bacterium]